MQTAGTIQSIFHSIPVQEVRDSAKVPLSSTSANVNDSIHILRVRVAIAPSADGRLMLTFDRALTGTSYDLSDKMDRRPGSVPHLRSRISYRYWFQAFTSFTKPTRVIHRDNSSIPSLARAAFASGYQPTANIALYDVYTPLSFTTTFPPYHK